MIKPPAIIDKRNNTLGDIDQYKDKVRGLVLSELFRERHRRVDGSPRKTLDTKDGRLYCRSVGQKPAFWIDIMK